MVGAPGWCLPLANDAVLGTDTFDQLADPAPAPPGAAGQARRGRRFTMASEAAAQIRAPWDGWAMLLPGAAGAPDTLALVADRKPTKDKPTKGRPTKDKPTEDTLTDWWQAAAPTVAGAPLLTAWSGVDGAAVRQALEDRLVAAVTAALFPAPGATAKADALLWRNQVADGTAVSKYIKARADCPKSSDPAGEAWCRARVQELLPTLRGPTEGAYRRAGAVWLPAGEILGRCAADGARWWTELSTFDPVGIPVDPLHYLHVLHSTRGGRARHQPLTPAQLAAWGLDGARPEPLRADAGVIRLPAEGGTAVLRREFPAFRLLAGPTPVPKKGPYPQATHWRVDEEASVVGLMSRRPADTAAASADPADWVAWPPRVGDWPLLVRDLWAAHGPALATMARELLLPCELVLAWCAQWAGGSRLDTTGRPSLGAERAVTVNTEKAVSALRSACLAKVTGQSFALPFPGTTADGQRRLTLDRPAVITGPTTFTLPSGATMELSVRGTYAGQVLTSQVPHRNQLAALGPAAAGPPAAAWFLPLPEATSSTFATTTDDRRLVVDGGRIRGITVSDPKAWFGPLSAQNVAASITLLVDGLPAGPVLAAPTLGARVVTAEADVPIDAGSALSIRISASQPIERPFGITVSVLVEPPGSLVGATLPVDRLVSVRLPETLLDPATRPLPAADLTVRQLADLLPTPGAPASVQVGLCQLGLGDVPGRAAWLRARGVPGLAAGAYAAPTDGDGWLALLGELLTAEHAARLGLVAARLTLFEQVDGFDPWLVGGLADALTAAFAFFRELPGGMASPTVRWELPQSPAAAPVADATALEQLAGQQPLTQQQLDRERARLSIPAHDYRRIHRAQKRLHLQRLRNRYGFGTGPQFEYGSTDLRNLAKLEAVAEFFLNCQEPRFPTAGVAGFSAPLSEADAGYLTVDLFGPAGSSAVAGPNRTVTLSGYPADQVDELSRLKPAADDGHHRDLLEVDGQRVAITAVLKVTATECVVQVTPALAAPAGRPWRVRRHPQLVLIDPFGPAEGLWGEDGTGEVTDATGRLSFPLRGRPGLSHLYVGMDTVRLPDDTAGSPPARSFRIVGADPFRPGPPPRKGKAVAPAPLPDTARLRLDSAPVAGTGRRWYAPAGVGGFPPPLQGAADVQREPATADRLVDYRGALFLVTGGQVRGPWRWASMTFQGNDPKHLFSARGNTAYDITGIVSGADGGSFRNYCLGVANAVPAGFLNADTIAEARLYWTGTARADAAAVDRAGGEPVLPGRTIGTIRLHDGHAWAPSSTGSWGCMVSPDYYTFRRTLIEAHLAERDDLSTAERDLLQAVLACDRRGSVLQHQRSTPPGEFVPPLAHRKLWEAVHAATLYLVRPEERSTPALITAVTNRQELSQTADTTVNLALAGVTGLPRVFLASRELWVAGASAEGVAVSVARNDVIAAKVTPGTQGRLAIGSDADHLVASTTVWVKPKG